MPDFRLELMVPDPIPAGRAKSTFYWSSNARDSFESTYGPDLGRLGPVASPNIDFVRIAAAAFTADRSIPRWGGGSNWNSRDIGLTVPVNSPDLWRSVSDDLSSLLGLLTGDSWRLEFVPDYGSSITTSVQGGMWGDARMAARRLAWERLARSLLSCVSSSHRSNSVGPNRSRGSISRTTR